MTLTAHIKRMRNYGLTGRQYSEAERRQIARTAFWDQESRLLKYVRWLRGYQMDGQEYPANALSLDECIETVLALPDDQIERLTDGPLVPIPGDAVLVTAPYRGVARNNIAVVDGEGYGILDGKLLATFGASAFRGMDRGVMSRPGDGEVVSCSGGPCPLIRIDELRFTGRAYAQQFWRWQDVPRARGGVSYTLHVPLWEWAGERGA